MNFTFYCIFKTSGIWSFAIRLVSFQGLNCFHLQSEAMLDPVKGQSIPPKYHKQLTQRHSIAYCKIGLISCYEYYVRINMIIQSISILFCFNTEYSLWMRWPMQVSNHFPHSVHIKNEWKDTLLLGGTAAGGEGVVGFNPPPLEISKALQNRAKLKLIVKTVKICWI